MSSTKQRSRFWKSSSKANPTLEGHAQLGHFYKEKCQNIAKSRCAKLKSVVIKSNRASRSTHLCKLVIVHSIEHFTKLFLLLSTLIYRFQFENKGRKVLTGLIHSFNIHFLDPQRMIEQHPELIPSLSSQRTPLSSSSWCRASHLALLCKWSSTSGLQPAKMTLRWQSGQAESTVPESPRFNS